MPLPLHAAGAASALAAAVTVAAAGAAAGAAALAVAALATGLCAGCLESPLAVTLPGLAGGAPVFWTELTTVRWLAFAAGAAGSLVLAGVVALAAPVISAKSANIDTYFIIFSLFFRKAWIIHLPVGIISFFRTVAKEYFSFCFLFFLL